MVSLETETLTNSLIQRAKLWLHSCLFLHSCSASSSISNLTGSLSAPLRTSLPLLKGLEELPSLPEYHPSPDTSCSLRLQGFPHPLSLPTSEWSDSATVPSVSVSCFLVLVCPTPIWVSWGAGAGAGGRHVYLIYCCSPGTRQGLRHTREIFAVWVDNREAVWL